MDDCLLKIDDVKRIVSMGDTWIYDQISKGQFPKPIKLSTRASRWRQSDINAWIAAQSSLEKAG